MTDSSSDVELARSNTGYGQGFIQRYYSVLSRTYDPTLTLVYRGARRQLSRMLEVSAGERALVVGCGTGADFDWVHDAVGLEGSIVGVDYSPAMLDRARARVERRGWTNVRLVEADAATVSPETLGEAMPPSGAFDIVVASLALSVIPGWRAAFEASWSMLAEGGRYGILDGHGRRGPVRWFAPLLDMFAASDIRRPTWALLDGRATDVRRGGALLGYLHLTVGTRRRPEAS